MLCFSACFVFTTSCKDDEETPAVTKIEGTVVNGSDYDVDEIVGRINIDEKMSTDFVNNHFSMELPATVDDKYLMLIDYDEEFNISDPNAKVALLSLNGYNSGSFECFLSYTLPGMENTEKWEMYESALIYVDRNVTITGMDSWYDDDDETDNVEICNLNLKKGWNWVYNVYTFTVSDRTYTDVSTTVPLNGWKWYFENDYYKSASMKSTEKIKKTKSNGFFR